MDDKPEKTINRREAIKMLALSAAGAITSLALGRDAFAWNEYYSYFSHSYSNSYSSYDRAQYSSYSPYSSQYSSYSSHYTSHTTPDSSGRLKINDEYGGGIVFYVDASGQHGLIVAREDICKPYTDQWGANYGSTGIFFRWSTGEDKNADAPDYAYGLLGTSTGIGTGRSNTEKILTKYSPSRYPNSAAAVAQAYRGGGRSDWFLPSRDELAQLYSNRNVVGGFSGSFYWSSTEYSADYAWFQYFTSGYQDFSYKYLSWCVRAVRAF